MRIAAWLLVALGWLPGALMADAIGEARAHLEAGRYAEAQAAARARLAETPDAAEALAVLGDALAATGKIDAALAAYRRVPAGPAGPRLDVEMAMARIERIYGDAAAGDGRAQRILQAYRDRRATLSPRELVAAGDAARALAREDPALYVTALRIYEQAIAQDPRDPAAHVAIGDLLLDRFNNEEALNAYRTALELDGSFVPALIGLARSQHFDHSTGAMDAARAALEARPADVQALTLLARLQLELEEYAEAGSLVDHALGVNPRSPQALTLAAALAFLDGDNEAMESRIARVRELAPGHAVYETLAEIAAQNRYYASAGRFAQLAIYQDRNSWRAYALLGVNRLRLGEMQAGRAALEVAFKNDPFDPRSKNALELLDKLDNYARVASERFVLTADPDEAPVLAPRVLAIAEDAYDHFAGAYGHHPPTPIRIEFYRRHEDFSVRTTGLVGVDILGVSFGPVVALDSPSAGVFGPVNFGATLWHELAHTFHLGLTRSRVPRWFSEGLAVFEERRARPGWGFDVTPGFLGAFREGRLAPASDLNRAFLRPTYPEQIPHAYFQAALLMELIERDHGFDAITAMLQGYRDGLSTPELFREVLEREPEELDADFDAFVRDRFARALDALEPVVDAELGPMPKGRYPHLLDVAGRALESGELDRAMAALTEAQALFPEHAGPGSTYSMLAALHEKTGDRAGAIDQLSKAIAIDADDLDAHRRLAALQLEADDGAAAAEVLERALLIQPFDPALHRRLAEIRESQNRWADAAQARQAVAALDPADPVEARYLLARAHFRAGDPQAARRAVLAALESAPMYAEALELLLLIRDASGAGESLEKSDV